MTCYFRDHCQCCPLGDLGDLACRDERCPPKLTGSPGYDLWQSMVAGKWDGHYDRLAANPK